MTHLVRHGVPQYRSTSSQCAFTPLQSQRDPRTRAPIHMKPKDVLVSTTVHVVPDPQFMLCLRDTPLLIESSHITQYI